MPVASSTNPFQAIGRRSNAACGRCSSPRSSLEIRSAECSRLPNTTPTGSTRVTPRWSPGSRLRWWSRSSTSACARNTSEWPRPSSTAAGSNAGWNVCGERSLNGTDSIASWGAPEPFARPWTRQPWSPGRRQRSCSRAKAGPGRSWSLAPSTTPAAALPETLAESELFGHERGAFTGADRLKRGRFEVAAGGTLFLDEIGDLTPSVQAKLLRVLQERQYERVVGTTSLRADVRLIAATNRDLGHRVETGTFRDDLFYRLAVFGIHLPSLREREGDVLVLAEYFLRTLGERMGRRQSRLSDQARQLLLAHTWPGNIRELQNAIERALIAADGHVISAAHLGIGGHRSLVAGLSSGAPIAAGSVLTSQPLAVVEKQAVADALRRAKGNKTQAAAALGLRRGAFHRRLERFGFVA